MNFRETDIFIVSYPKSGSTWLRWLLSSYINNDYCDFFKINETVPDVYYNPDQLQNINFRPRFIKSHQPYKKEYKNVIYLVRDGRDVAVSYYFHSLKYKIISQETSFETFITKLFNHNFDGFGIWSDHVRSWLEQKTSNFLLLRYEDMIKDVVGEFKKVLNFAEMPIYKNKLLFATEQSNFEQVRKIEKEQQKDSPLLRKSNLEIPFVRSGKVGEWEYFLVKKYYNLS